MCQIIIVLLFPLNSRLQVNTMVAYCDYFSVHCSCDLLCYFRFPVLCVDIICNIEGNDTTIIFVILNKKNSYLREKSRIFV